MNMDYAKQLEVIHVTESQQDGEEGSETGVL